MCIERDLYIWKETYVYMKRDLCIYDKRPMCIERDLYIYIKRPIHMKRDLCTGSRPTPSVYMKRDLYTWKRTYVHEKEKYSKRDLCIGKETDIYMKRDGYIYEKRRIYTERTLHEKRHVYVERTQYIKKKEKGSMFMGEKSCFCLWYGGFHIINRQTHKSISIQTYPLSVYIWISIS